MFTIAAQKRTTEKPHSLRQKGLIPAVYYKDGKDAVAITVPLMEFVKMFREAGETTTITLDLGSEKVTTLVHDMQRDPITNAPMHIDFLIVDMNKEIEVTVPLEFTGTPEAEKGGLGTLVKVLHEVEVRALPAKLPHSVAVDVSNIATLDDKLHVSDIKLPEGVIMVTSGEEVVAAMAAYVEEKEEAPVDFESIEVEKKGKKEEEEAPASE